MYIQLFNLNDHTKALGLTLALDLLARDEQLPTATAIIKKSMGVQNEKDCKK